MAIMLLTIFVRLFFEKFAFPFTQKFKKKTDILQQKK